MTRSSPLDSSHQPKNARFPHLGACCILLLLALLSGRDARAQLYFSGLYVEPATIQTGSPVSARMPGQGCQSTAVPIVTRADHSIEITFSAAPLPACGTVPPTELSIPLGSFAPGTYVVRAPAVQAANQPLTLTASLVVLADPQPIPSIQTPLLLLGLVLAMLIIGAAARHRSRTLSA